MARQPLRRGFSGRVVAVATNAGEDESGRGPAGAITVGVPPTAVFSVGVTGDGVLAAGASFKVGPSSGSVDVEVVVRYNAVRKASIGSSTCNGALPSLVPKTHLAVYSQFQIPRSGKKFSIMFPAFPQVCHPTLTNVQPLGSTMVLTPVDCTPSGRSG